MSGQGHCNKRQRLDETQVQEQPTAADDSNRTIHRSQSPAESANSATTITTTTSSSSGNASPTSAAPTTTTTTAAEGIFVDLSHRLQIPWGAVPPELLTSDYADNSKNDDLKEWIWDRYSEQIKESIVIKTTPADEPSEFTKAQERRLKLLDNISSVQRQYLQMQEPRVVFGNLLESLLQLTDSEYGFIGEVKLLEDGTKYLQTHAITNIAWNATTQAFYENNVESGLKFFNLESLFGHVIVEESPVISNTPSDHPAACGVPEGHPPLNHFLGIPFFEGNVQDSNNPANNSDSSQSNQQQQQHQHKMNGMVGIANKPGGYSQADIDFLEPFTVTCSNLIQAYGAIRQNKYLINTLEEKVEQRTHALALANQHLEKANKRVVEASRAQLQHFACMSHEIRTPLNCIMGLSSLLQDTPLNPHQADSLQMIVTSGDLLLTVVNDVLDYSKLESGNVDICIRPSNLQAALDAVVHSIAQKAKSKLLKVQTLYGINVPEEVETDSRRLQQILYNLLGNAVKFSQENGTIELKVSVQENTTHTNSATTTTSADNKDENKRKHAVVPALEKAKEKHHKKRKRTTKGERNEQKLENNKSLHEENFNESSNDEKKDDDDNTTLTSPAIGMSKCPFHSTTPEAANDLHCKSNGKANKLETAAIFNDNDDDDDNENGDEYDCNDDNEGDDDLMDEGNDTICESTNGNHTKTRDEEQKEPKNGTLTKTNPNKSKKNKKQYFSKVLRFSVKDYGTGIDPKDFSRIFKPFKQANSFTEQLYGGTGLGLAITSKLVRGLGGKISVDSVKGEWSEFTVEFPFKPCSTKYTETSIAQENPLVQNVFENMTIFSVSNNDDARNVEEHVFDSNGIRYIKFASMRDLLSKVTTKKTTTAAKNGMVVLDNQQHFYVYLVQEDLFELEPYQKLSKSCKSALLTFGPQYSVSETDRHFRSLSQVLPSVLMKFLLEQKNEALTNPSDSSQGPNDKSGRDKNKADNDASSSNATNNSHHVHRPISYDAIRVLIAEDNPINQKVLQRMLHRLGVQHVDIVDNGKLAVDRHAREPEDFYHIIYMDMQMPVMDGLEACRLISKRKKQLAAEKNMDTVMFPKVIFVTANVTDGYENEAREAGGDGFISKPFSIDGIERSFRQLTM